MHIKQVSCDSWQHTSLFSISVTPRWFLLQWSGAKLTLHSLFFLQRTRTPDSREIKVFYCTATFDLKQSVRTHTARVHSLRFFASRCLRTSLDIFGYLWTSMDISGHLWTINGWTPALPAMPALPIVCSTRLRHVQGRRLWLPLQGEIRDLKKWDMSLNKRSCNFRLQCCLWPT